MRVLAISIDALDPELTRALIDDGELPTLASLLDTGTWAEVDSRADVGSGAVWPTFLTGSDPNAHELYFGWRWDPGAMACTPADHAPAFWEAMRAKGEPVGQFDVPFATTEPVAGGFSVSGWGAHQEILGSLDFYPAWVRELVKSKGRHPYQGLPETPLRFRDRASREELSAACVRSAAMRADLVIRLMDRAEARTNFVNFSEVHRASHQLWRTADPYHPLYTGLGSSERGLGRPDIRDVYREVDRQAGRMIEAAGPETAVAVFSLHGMRPTLGIPAILEPLLVELGFAARGEFTDLSWGGRARALFGTAKRRAPAPLKRLYHRATTTELRHRLATPTMVRPYAWPRTRAFALPTDQHGYVKVNLAGRETEGIVPESEYVDTCDELERILLGLRNADGERLVTDVLRPEREWGEPPQRLPDLIAHWAEPAFAGRVRAVSGSVAVEADPDRPDRIGQHAPHGVCILDPRLTSKSVGEVVAGKDLHRLLVGEAAGAPTATV